MLSRVMRLICAAILAGPAGLGSLRAQQPGPVKVVASFSVLADLVRAVGGERIELVTLVGPGGESHAYTPAPADAKSVASARLVIVNGLGFEGWLPRLAASSGNRAKFVEASAGIAARRTQGEDGRQIADPHAWQSVANVRIYVANIREALSSVDPASAAAYSAAAEGYLARLDTLEAEIRDGIGRIPTERRKLVTTHDAFGYFAAAYGLEVMALQSVAADTEPTARAIAALVTEIRRQKIPAVFREPVSDPRLIERIASEAGATVGGALYADSLTDSRGEAPTYIDMMRHNIRVLTSALGTTR